MQTTIEPYEFDIPNQSKRRWAYVLKHSIVQLIVTLVFVVATIYAWAVSVDLWGQLALTGVTSVAVGLSLYWGFDLYQNPKYSYTLYETYDNRHYRTRRIRFQFDEPYFVPKEKMRVLVDRVTERFQDHLDTSSEYHLLLGSTFVVTSTKPYSARRGTKVLGKTYPDQQLSEVYGPRALDDTVMGYEMRLQIMHQLFPFQSERQDIEWMNEHSIL